MSRFNKVLLKDITKKIGSGATPTGGQNSYHEEGISLIRSQNVHDFQFSMNGLAYINEDQAKSLNNVTVEENDILLNITGDSIARVCIVPKKILPARVNQHVSIIRCKNDISTPYVFYYLENLKPYLLKICGVGGTRNALTKEAVEKLEINIPNFSTQQKIASVLSSLDSKIDLNNRINRELDQMAKLLYDYWFVQFEFPNKEGKPYKTSGGKMVWNEELKRVIPDGWKVKRLRNIESNIVTGKTPPTNNIEFYNGNVPFITIGDIRGNMHVVKTEMMLSQSGADIQKNKYIPKGSLCVTCIASPGLIGFATDNSQTNQQINSVVIEDEENRTYLYFALNDYFKFAKGAKTGNTFANMNKGDFEEISLIHPPKNILLSFEKFARPTVEEILNLSKENQQLASLRDWLLPMLMNGQVTVGAK